MQVRRAEVNINEKRPVPIFCEQNPEIPGQETLAGSSLSTSNGPYMRHGTYPSSILSYG